MDKIQWDSICENIILLDKDKFIEYISVLLLEHRKLDYYIDFDGTLHIGNQWKIVSSLISDIKLHKKIMDTCTEYKKLENENKLDHVSQVRWMIDNFDIFKASYIYENMIRDLASSTLIKPGFKKLLKYGYSNVHIVSYGIWDYINWCMLC